MEWRRIKEYSNAALKKGKDDFKLCRDCESLSASTIDDYADIILRNMIDKK